MYIYIPLALVSTVSPPAINKTSLPEYALPALFIIKRRDTSLPLSDNALRICQHKPSTD
jgi:hypothetical protein